MELSVPRRRSPFKIFLLSCLLALCVLSILQPTWQLMQQRWDERQTLTSTDPSRRFSNNTRDPSPPVPSFLHPGPDTFSRNITFE